MNSEEVFPPSNRSGSTIEVLNVQCDEAQEAACTDSFLARYKQHQMDDVGVPHPERYTDPISDGDVDDGPEDANNTHNNPSVNQVMNNNNNNKVHEEESGGDFLLCSDSPTSAIMSADRNISTARSSNNNNNKIKTNTQIVVSSNELLRPTSAEGGPRRRCNIPSKRLADSPRRPSLSRTGSPARRAQNNDNSNNNNSINNRSHSQRRSGSLTAPRSGRRSSSVATSASAATHDKTGGQVLTLSPEMLRGYVAGLVQHHRSTLAVWTERVTTAELYRDKPTRTGGRPAAARPQDRSFLERAQRSVAIYAVQLADTKALLTREHELYSEEGIDDDRPAFGKHASAGPHHNHRSKAVVEWRTYCLTASGHLEALLLEVRSMQQRVDGLLAIPSHYDPYNPTARDDGWSATRRSGSRQRSATPSRRSSISRDERGHEMLSPQHPYRPQIEERRDSVMRGSAVIRPGSEQRASGSGWERSPSRSQAAAASASASAPPPPPQSGSSAAQISAAAARILHPDTRLRDCYCPSSPYDRTSPYGRLSPARTSSPSRVSATHHQPLPQPSRLYIAHEAVNDDGDGNGQRADKADDAQLTLIPPSLPLDAVRQEEGSGVGALELETYSSPRGPAVAATPLPHLSDERRTQLLLVIEQFEKNPLSLRKSDLRYARECFSELFGPQRGLRQYCSWVDELALAVIRQGH